MIIIEFYSAKMDLVEYFQSHNTVRCGITNASNTKTFWLDFDFGVCPYNVERVNRLGEKNWEYLKKAIVSAKEYAEKAYREARPKLADIVV
jgi:hypothetical protein